MAGDLPCHVARNALHQENGGAGVPQIVDPKILDSERADQSPEPLPHVPPVRAGGDKAIAKRRQDVRRQCHGLSRPTQNVLDEGPFGVE